MTTVVTYTDGTKWEGVIDTSLRGTVPGSSAPAPTNQIPHVTDAASIILQDNITKIDQFTFYNCQSLRTLYLPKELVYINGNGWYPSLWSVFYNENKYTNQSALDSALANNGVTRSWGGSIFGPL